MGWCKERGGEGMTDGERLDELQYRLDAVEEELDLWESMEYLTDREQVMNLVREIRKILFE